jgi:pSer/pThr/pTyr-binding forkhead associated (FHA) protein
MSVYLKVLASPDDKANGIKLVLAEGENLVGRKRPPALIQLDGTKVSKKHCMIEMSGASLKVVDLKSSNGLYVNGKRVESAVLKDKDRLVIGEFILEVTVK